MGITFQKITLDVRIAGARVPRVIGVDTSAGISQINASATIHLTSRPSYAVEGAAVEIWAGYDGHTDIIFKGELEGTEWEFFPGVVSLPARDLLARTRLDWGDADRTYTSQDDAAIIRNLLEAMGIPSSQASITSSSWTMGVVEDVVAPQGRAFWPLIAEIDDLAGYRTYTDRAGIIRRKRVSGNIGTGQAFTYTEGDNIISITRRRNVDGIVNKCVVTGIDYEGLSVGGPGVAEAQADNPFVPNPPRYITLAIQSNLVEDNTKALEIAQRQVKDKNRRPETFELEVPGQALISPLSIIRIQHSDVEVAIGQCIVDRVQHSIRQASFRTTITTLGGTVDATSTNVEPVAAFDLKIFQEGEDTGSVASILIGVADATASTDPDGTTLTYSWTLSVDAGTVTPTSGSTSVLRFTITGAATQLTIALTVTDAGGATNVLSRVVPLTTANLWYEPLYTAEGTIIAATDNGEQTWASYTLPGGALATCLAPFAPDWGDIWGANDGHIYASIDKLATSAVDLGAPNGSTACTAVWVHEIDTTRLWAGFNDGKVYSGTIDPVAVTATWVLAGTAPEGPVSEIRESVGALGELRVTAGQGYYLSGDGGIGWSLLHSFDVAWRMAAGYDRNIATGLNTTPPIFEESGLTPTVPGGVTHLRGITFGWRIQDLYATNDAAALYTTGSAFTAFTAHADSLPAVGNHLIRSGNVDGVVYAACGDGTGVNNGAVKWLPGTKAPWYIRKTTARKVYMIGYGPAHPKVAPISVLMPPLGATGAADKLWRYTPGAGWEGITPPKAGWYWWGVAASQFNRNHLLMWGNSSNNSGGSGYTMSSSTVKAANGTDSPLYRSTDGGSSWTAMSLHFATTKDRTDSGLFVAWSESDTALWFAGMTLDFIPNREQECIWRGDNSASSFDAFTISTASTQQDFWGLTGGLDGEVIAAATTGNANPQQFGYVARGASTYTVTASDINQTHTGLERLAGLSRGCVSFAGSGGDDLYVSRDYHSETPAVAVADIGFNAAATADGYVFVCGIASAGITQVTDVTGTPSTSLVGVTSGFGCGAIRSGRAQRLNVAARKSGSRDLFVRSGGVWSLLAGPSAAASNGSDVANAVEVLDGP